MTLLVIVEQEDAVGIGGMFLVQGDNLGLLAIAIEVQTDVEHRDRRPICLEPRSRDS
jgi:hypothetical protein